MTFLNNLAQGVGYVVMLMCLIGAVTPMKFTLRLTGPGHRLHLRIRRLNRNPQKVPVQPRRDGSAEGEDQMNDVTKDLLEALKLAECVYRKNVVNEGEPSSVLEAMQAAITAAEAQRQTDYSSTVDRAWARFCGAFGDGPDAPYPGMIAAFETHYGQSFRDKEWRTEAACWAAAWSKATARAEAALVEPDSLHAGEPVAARSDEDKARLRKALDAELQRPPTRDEVIRMALKAGFTWEPINNIADPLERFAALVMEAKDGPWKSAVIDQLVIAHILTAEHETDPRKAVQDLLAFESDIAIDPRVSKAAARLVEQARAEEREACAKVCERERDALNENLQVWQENPTLTPCDEFISDWDSEAKIGEQYAAAIRARGQK